jgi:rhodanese-related sulfurtransferase
MFGVLAALFMIIQCGLPQLSGAAGWQWLAPQRVAAMVKEGSGLWLIDVRNEAVFTSGHIEGALNIPASILGTKRLPKGKIIVLVDDSLGMRRGRDVAEILLKSGQDKVFLLEGGIPAWKNEGYPFAGKAGPQKFLIVMPDDVAWAQQNRVPLRIFDLRDKVEQTQGPVAQALTVAGKTLADRLDKVRGMINSGGPKGLAAKLEKPATSILVFPTASDPQLLLERSLRGVAGDVRYLEGGYAAWAAKPNKNIDTVGACPTCPGKVPGGKK